jgi:hypothetical protein
MLHNPLPSTMHATFRSHLAQVVSAGWSGLAFGGTRFFLNIGLAGAPASTYDQVGYSLADVVAKAVFGVLIWAIASGKSAEEEKGLL